MAPLRRALLPSLDTPFTPACAKREAETLRRWKLRNTSPQKTPWTFARWSWMCATATSLEQMVLYRGLQGMTGAFLMAAYPTTLQTLGAPENPPSDPEGLLLSLVERVFIRSATTMRRTALEEVGGFDPGVSGVDDFDLSWANPGQGPASHAGRSWCAGTAWRSSGPGASRPRNAPCAWAPCPGSTTGPAR